MHECIMIQIFLLKIIELLQKQSIVYITVVDDNLIVSVEFFTVSVVCST